jgi:hypothetical protein
MVRLARERGLTDAQILTVLVANEYGAAKRRALIREWAAALGLSEEEALLIAKKAGLIIR